MRRGAQCSHMPLEFVSEDLKRQPLLSWSLRLERLGLTNDGLRRLPSAGIPGAERFESDTKRYRALCLGQAEPRSNLPQDRVGLGHRS